MTIQRVTSMFALAMFLGSRAWASDKPEDAAQTAADSWLNLVDDAEYGASWDQA